MAENEDGYGGNFMSDDSVSPKSNHHQEEGNAGSSGSSEASPLGLKLRKTESFLSMLEMRLSQGKKCRAEVESCQEKLKASNFAASFIRIGTWQRWTRHEGDLTAKLYYAKQKLVWELLDGALKSKMEVQWSDIIAIKATTPDHNHMGVLQIELSHPPSFFRETNPQPRKHTLWQPAPDFTGGQAPIWRRHYVAFPPGTLDKHYQKLLQCDKRLMALSQKPFPSLDSPYFDPNMFGIEEISRRFNGGYTPLHYPHHSYPNPSMNIPFGISNHHILTHPPMHWNQEPSSSHGNHPFQSHHHYYQPNTGLHHHLPGGSQDPNHSNLNGPGFSVNHSGPGFGVNHTDMNLSGFNVNHSGRACDYGFGSSGDQVMQNGACSEPQQGNNLWAPPQGHSNGTMDMDQAMNNSLPSSFFFGDPTSGDDGFNF